MPAVLRFDVWLSLGSSLLQEKKGEGAVKPITEIVEIERERNGRRKEKLEEGGKKKNNFRMSTRRATAHTNATLICILIVYSEGCQHYSSRGIRDTS